jgi:hypothetical protein
MAAVPFDTLKRARRQEAAGFPTQQAGDMAEGIAEALSELATKADIAALRVDTKADITGLRADIELLRHDNGRGRRVAGSHAVFHAASLIGTTRREKETSACKGHSTTRWKRAVRKSARRR